MGRGDEEIGVAPAAVWCDVRAFESALDGGHLDEALALYRGHFLEGFHVSGVAPELGQWVDDERARLRTLAVGAASSLAERAERDGNHALAVQRLRDVLRLDAGAEGALRRLMQLLDRTGDRAGALRAYDDFARRLAAEIEAEPAAETTALADRIRDGRESAAAAAPLPAPAPLAPSAPAAPAAAAAAPPLARETPLSLLAPPRLGWSRRSRWLAAGAAAVLVVALGAAALLLLPPSLSARLMGRAAAPPAMVLAVGAVEDRAGADSLGSARVLRDLLATDLARVSGVTVVSQARMQELLARLGGGAETRASLARAARSAGAAEVLEGELYRRAPDALRLDVRRVDAATGVIRRAYTAEAGDLFALVERVSAQLAAEVGQQAPSPALAELTTTSLVARRFYEEGVRTLFVQADSRAALRLFQAALAEDSTFAMAAYFASQAALAADPVSVLPLAAHAVRMSRKATERERLLIATNWAARTNNPSYVVLAESLARRFPLEPDGEYELAQARAWSGDVLGAIPHFWRVVARDSASFAGEGGTVAAPQLRCWACDAYGNLMAAYHSLDSLAASERTAREWLRRQPRSQLALANLAVTLSTQGRAREALDVWQRRQSLFTDGPPDDVIERVTVYLVSGDFAEADRLLAERARGGSVPALADAYWFQVISFRNQGRLDEALRAAKMYEGIARGRLAEAQVLFERGQHLESARLFEAMAAMRPSPIPGAPDSALGLRTRSVGWHFTHAGTAYAAAGDTARLARLADSVEAIGTLGAYGRDRRLHHHLRGLLFLARGRREEAVESFRRALYSPTQGYTRTSLELGRTLLALGRPREAAAVLAPALRGDVQSSNYYVTHAELHEALAQAYEAAGQRDSARVHYAWVANAWKRADPQFRERAERARAKSR